MKLIIAGSRSFDRGDMVIEAIKEFKPVTEIVCGMAKGADMMGFHYGRIWNIPVKEFPANWDLYGKSAGYKRNQQMAKYADAALIFWDGISKGTKHMIDICQRNGMRYKVVRF